MSKASQLKSNVPEPSLSGHPVDHQLQEPHCNAAHPLRPSSHLFDARDEASLGPVYVVAQVQSTDKAAAMVEDVDGLWDNARGAARGRRHLHDRRSGDSPQSGLIKPHKMKVEGKHNRQALMELSSF